MDTINKNVLMLEFSFLSHRLLLPPTAALMPLHQKEPRCQEVTAAPLSLCPNSGIHPTSCWGTTASLSRDTTSTADGALTVRRRKCQAKKMCAWNAAFVLSGDRVDVFQRGNGWGSASLRRWTLCSGSGPFSWGTTSTGRCTRSSNSARWKTLKKTTGEADV